MSSSTLDRLLEVLGAFDIERPSMSLSELARATELPISTAQRLVRRLVAWGALERDHRNRYVIGLRIWELGVLSPHSFHQRARVVPLLERLFVASEEQVVLSGFRSDGSIIVEQILGWRESSMSAGLGERLPLHATSPGLVFLAFGPPDAWNCLTAPLRRFTPRTIVDRSDLRRELHRVRRASVAFSDGAFIEGTASISAPVFGYRGGLYGAVSVVFTSGAADPAALAPMVFTTAREMSSAMRGVADASLPRPVRRGAFGPSGSADRPAE